MKFDWYSATVPDVEPAVIASAVRSISEGGEWCDVVPARAQHGYLHGAQVKCGDLVHATMYYGGEVGDHGVHVFSSGSRAVALSAMLRKQFPVHRVSRVDSAEDYCEAGAFDRCTSIAEKVAQREGVNTTWLRNSNPAVGDTLYIGSRKSNVRARIYEKGKQLRADGDPQADPNHVRAEVQVRPQRVAKAYAASWSPSEVWGASKWSHRLGVEYGNVDLPRVQVRDWKQSEIDHALVAMTRQYQKAMRGKAVQLGGFPQLWRFIEELLATQEKER